MGKMKLYFTIFILVMSSVWACQSEDENADKESQKKEVEEESEDENLTEDNEASTDKETTVPYDRIQLVYKTAQEKYEKAQGRELPDTIDINAVYEKIGPCEFNEILKISDNYFLAHFYTASDVENNYYITFDLAGNFIDLKLYGTISYGVYYEDSFVANNFIQVINENQEGFEMDDNGDVHFDHSHINGEYFYLQNDGEIRSLNNKNQATSISDLSPELLDYYKVAIKQKLPGIPVELFPFNVIPGNNDGSTSDVYESLEGGGLYAKCLEVRDRNDILIGLIGYQYDPLIDSIPQTLTFVFSENQKPIIDYNIVSIEGRLYTEVITQQLSLDIDFVVFKSYYVFPMGNKEFVEPQTSVYSILGSLKDMLTNHVDNTTVKALSKL